MNRRIVLALATLLLVNVNETRAAAVSEKSDLTSILQSVWQNSQAISGARVQADLTGGDRWRRFVINEPQLSYSNSDDNTAYAYGLSLTTAFPGKAFAFWDLDKAKDKVQKAELAAKRYEVTRTVTQSYLDCAQAQENEELQRTTSNDAETIFKLLKNLYETGHSTQAEKIGSELQARQAKLDLTNAEDKETVACGKLRDLLERLNGESGSVHISKILVPDDLEASIVSELGSLTADQARAEASLALAKANYSTAAWSQFPDLTFNVNRNHYNYLPGSPSGKEWTNSWGVSVTLPILFPFHEMVESRRAKSQALIDGDSAEVSKNSADSDQLDGRKEYIRSRNRLRELRSKDLPLAEALVDSTYSAYRTGKLGYAELVLSRKTLTDIRSQDILLRASIVNSHLRCLDRCEQKDSK